MWPGSESPPTFSRAASQASQAGDDPEDDAADDHDPEDDAEEDDDDGLVDDPDERVTESDSSATRETRGRGSLHGSDLLTSDCRFVGSRVGATSNEERHDSSLFGSSSVVRSDRWSTNSIALHETGDCGAGMSPPIGLWP